MRILAWSLAACCIQASLGCGSSASAATGDDASPDSDGASTEDPTSQVVIGRWELAQTHVIPPSGAVLVAPKSTENLHLVGARDALAIVRAVRSDLVAPTLEGWSGGKQLGSVPLDAASALPPTESSGPAYATDALSAIVPGAWMLPGLSLRVSATGLAPSDLVPVSVGADDDVTLVVLPFYLFGANDGNTQPLSAVQAPPDATVQEIFAKWPVSSVVAKNHPAARAIWPSVVIGPRADRNGTQQPAYVVTAAEQQKDGYAVMSSVLSILTALRAANGEGPGPNQYYAPLLMIDSTGKSHAPGGGLGGIGTGAGVGDASYGGIFIHEQGHAMSLPHQGDAFEQGKFPYVAGSLAGSSWGWDPTHRELLAPFVPTNASHFASCATQVVYTGTDPSGAAVSLTRQLDSSGRCVKQDPMQSGNGDQAAGYRFATFSDFSTAMMQRWYEGTTTDSGGTHQYAGGRIFDDPSHPGAYRRWDSIDHAWTPVTQTTDSNGIWGLDLNLPVQRNVPVHAIVVTLDLATPSVSTISPPLSFTGNLLHTIDPSDPAALAEIVPDTSKYPWYCRDGGCDYTLRVTYAGGSVRTVVLQGGFRPFNQATGTPPASTTDPLSADGIHTWVINVPAPAAIAKIELLDTPQVWNGMPASPRVLLSR
jgi:hypothetical protein